MFFEEPRNVLSSKRFRTITGDILIQHHFKMIADLKQLRFDFERQVKANSNGILSVGTDTKYIDVLDSMLRIMTLFNKTLPYSFSGTYALTDAQCQFLELFYQKSNNSNTPLDSLCNEFINENKSNNTILDKFTALSKVFVAEHNRYIERANFFKEKERETALSFGVLSLIYAMLSIRLISDVAFAAAVNAAGAWIILAAMPMIICAIFLFLPVFLQYFAKPYKEKAEEILKEEYPRLVQQIADLHTASTNLPTVDSTQVGCLLGQNR